MSRRRKRRKNRRQEKNKYLFSSINQLPINPICNYALRELKGIKTPLALSKAMLSTPKHYKEWLYIHGEDYYQVMGWLVEILKHPERYRGVNYAG